MALRRASMSSIMMMMVVMMISMLPYRGPEQFTLWDGRFGPLNRPPPPFVTGFSGTVNNQSCQHTLPTAHSSAMGGERKEAPQPAACGTMAQEAQLQPPGGGATTIGPDVTRPKLFVKTCGGRADGGGAQLWRGGGVGGRMGKGIGSSAKGGGPKGGVGCSQPTTTTCIPQGCVSV